METLRRRKVEQRLTSQEQTLNKAEGQHKVKKTDEGVQRKGTLTRYLGRIKRRQVTGTRPKFGNLRTCTKISFAGQVRKQP